MAKCYELVTHKGLLRNQGIGDYFERADGSWIVLATQMKEPRHSDLILLHEVVETMLIRQAGIPEPVIDAFDALFEVERSNGMHGPDDEPGDDSRAPYFHQHQLASKIERLMCEEGFGLSWQEYETACNAVGEEG